MKTLLFLILTGLTAANPLLVSFNSGELAPLVKYRLDLQQYESGCQTLENMIVLTQGAAMRRPGTEYVGTTKSSGQARLIPFEYSTTDAYILEFGDEYMRVFREVAGVPGQILAGYGTEDYSVLTAYGDLTAHWVLDEDAATSTVADVAGTYSGTLDGNSEDVHWFGKVGSGCFDFDMAETVTVLDDDAFTFTESDPFSLTAWIYVTDTENIQTIISKWDATSGAEAREWRFQLLSEETLRLELYDNSSDLTGDCVSQWKLNDIDADTVVDDTQSIHAGVATANCSVITDPAGKISSCFDFDGQYAVEITDDASPNHDYSFGDSNADSPFSVSLWFYVPSAGDTTLVSKWDTNGKREWKITSEYNSFTQDTRFRAYLYDDQANQECSSRTGTLGLSFGWHHLVMTYTGQSTAGATAANLIKIYIDGVSKSLLATNNASYDSMIAPASITPAAKMCIGAHYTLGTRDDYYQSKIDNVCIFDVELSQGQVDSLYADGSGTEDLLADSPYATTDDALEEGWHFVAASYNDTNGGANAADSILLYVDGALVDSTAHNVASGYTTMDNTAADVRIGSQYSSAGANQYVFADKIDDVAVWDDILSAAEIAEMYSEAACEIETVYSTADLRDLQYVQVNDVIYIACNGHAPQKLSRYNHDLWTIEDVDFKWGPFLDENTEDTTITPSAATGTITLTASTPLFVPDHEGALWKIREKQDPSYVNKYFDEDESSDTITLFGDYFLRIKGNYNGLITLEKSDDSGTSWASVYSKLGTPGTQINLEYSGNEPEKGWLYRVTMSAWAAGDVITDLVSYNTYLDGYVKILDYVSPTVVQAEVIETLADTAATKKWAEGAWSNYRGWPETVNIYQSRLVFARTEDRPTTMWTSKSFKFEDFDTGSGLDDESIVYDITIAKQNPILWMEDLDTMLVGTGGGLFRWGSLDAATALTPDNPSTKRLSGYGVSAIQPSILAESLLFIERGAHKVNELAYQLDADGYVASDMTLLASHIAESPIVETAAQNRPYPMLWCVREDGVLLTLSYHKKQGVLAWGRQITDGTVESAAVIPGTDEDQVWLIVNRTIDSSTVRYIEQVQPFEWGSSDSNMFFVDSGLTGAVVASATVSGLDHLEGKVVAVLADGELLYDGLGSDPNFTVTSGDIDIHYAAGEATPSYTKVIAGLPYTSTLKTMPLEVQTQTGFTIGRSKRVKQLFVAYEDTMEFEYGETGGTFWPVKLEDRTAISTPTTGYRPLLPFTQNNSEEVAITLRQTKPYPMKILALYPKTDYAN